MAIIVFKVVCGMYFDTDVELKDRKRLVLKGFRGVDAASPMYAVDSYRASAMRNFISKDGSNHKRPGWNQVLGVKDLPINGYFKFVLAHEELEVVYAGTEFHIKRNGEWGRMEGNKASISNNVDTSRLKNCAVQMFIDNDRAYFIGCGDFLVLGIYDGELQFRRVYNDDCTYVPTTTVNISPEETDYYEDGSVVEYGARQSFRDVNILTSSRINTLIGSDYYMNTAEAGELAATPVVRTYKLDGENFDSNGFSVIARDYDAETGKSTEYALKIGNKINDGTTVTRNVTNEESVLGKSLRFDTTVKKIKDIGRYDETSQKFYIVKTDNFSVFCQFAGDTNTIILHYELGNEGRKKVAVGIRPNENEPYYIKWTSDADKPIDIDGVDSATITDTYNAGKSGWNITFDGMPARKYTIINEEIASDPSEDAKTCANARKWGEVDFDKGEIALTVHPQTISGEANITVTVRYDDSEYAERILDARFGALFGTSGNANTLFVSGCDDFPNYDFWSSAEDFTYFPSNNLCSIGTSSTKIMGYQRLGDDSLAIFKEGSVSEPTLYIRTGIGTTISEDFSGVQEGYYLTAGKYITQGAVSRDGIGMLNGDALFLSKQGVYGVQINSDSIAIEQRVAKERSRLINPLLKKHKDLSHAVSIVYDNKFYIALDEYVYVADARFVFTQSGDMSDTYNYDWWVWDNCPVRRFFVVDDALYFGTADGRICVFDDEFEDRTYEKLDENGGYSFDISNHRVQCNDKKIKFSDDDLACFKGNIYRLLLEVDGSDRCGEVDIKITVSDDDAKKLYEGQEVYADSIDGTCIDVDTKYFVTDITSEIIDGEVTNSFYLTTESGERIQPNGSFRLLCDISGEIVKVKTETDTKNNTTLTYIKPCNRYSGEEYVLANYNNGTVNACVYKCFIKNVVAEWYTPIMDMGASDYIKTLTGITVAAQQITNGIVKIGWETKNKNGIKEIDSRGLNVFDFSNLDFGNFTFNTGFESAYTKRMKTSFNYILFRFVSDSNCDCCVYSLTIEYKFNRKNKGVW